MIRLTIIIIIMDIINNENNNKGQWALNERIQSAHQVVLHYAYLITSPLKSKVTEGDVRACRGPGPEICGTLHSFLLGTASPKTLEKAWTKDTRDGNTRLLVVRLNLGSITAMTTSG
jgi:hypothetical protein